MFPDSNFHIFISTDYIEKCQPDMFALFPQCENLPMRLICNSCIFAEHNNWICSVHSFLGSGVS